jgi:hypothetical protein
VTFPAGAVSPRRRPVGVTILAILQLLGFFTYGLTFAALLVDGPATIDGLIGSSSAGGVSRDAVATGLTVLTGVLCVASLAAGVFLLRMRQLGWTITMALTGLNLALTIYLWWAEGTTLAIWVIVQVVTVFYLNQLQVRQAFGITRRETGAAPDEGRG